MNIALILLNILGCIIYATLLNAVPLLYAGIGSCISESAGVVNIGIEGMMTIGAFVGCTVAYFTNNPWLGFIYAGCAGMVLALLHAIASIFFKADQTISGTAINMLGTGIAVMTSYAIFGAVDSMPLSMEQKIPILFHDCFDVTDMVQWFLFNVFATYATTYLVFILVIVVSFVFYKTRFGMHLRACGEHPKACETLGINVIAVRMICVLLSGFFAGLGGATITLAVTNQFTIVSVVGQGFIAMSAVIFGKYRPKGVLIGCLLFGFCCGMKLLLNGVNVSPHLLSMFPYVITIIVLMFSSKNAYAPKASGKPYARGE